MSSADRDGTKPLRRLLEHAALKSPYDVEAGVVRHQQLIAQGAPMPEWASVLRARLVPSAWMWSVLGGVLVLGGWALHETPSAAPSAQARVASAAARIPPTIAVHPAIMPLVAAAVPPVAPQSAALASTAAAPTPQLAEARPHSAAPERRAAARRLPAKLAPERSGVFVARARARRSPEPGAASAEPARALEPTLQTPTPEPDPPSFENVSVEPAVRSTAPQAIDPEVLEEMEQLAIAERLLPTMPSRTLTLVREGMQRFAHGYLAQERRYLEIMALLGLKKPKDAELLSRGFLRDYPNGPYRRKVERALDESAGR